MRLLAFHRRMVLSILALTRFKAKPPVWQYLHTRAVPRGPLGGLQPLQMVDTEELENRWKEPLGKQPTNNIMRDARLSQ